MSLRLRVLLIILLVVCALVLVRQAKRNKVDIRYILSWMLLIFVLAILVFFPGLLGFITGVFGFALPINFLFLCGIIFTLVIIYTQTIAISKLNMEIKDLSQKIALLDRQERIDLDKDEKNE